MSQIANVNEEERYQVMPNLGAEEFRALKEDIDENGVLVPIAVDEEGQIIDGYHRMKACRELGIDAPVNEHEGLTEDEKISLAWRLNMQRRHLDRETKKSLIKDRLNQLIDRDVKKTDEEIAEELGCARSWVSTVRKTVVNDKLSENGGENVTADDFTTVGDYATSEQKENFIKDALVENTDESNRSIANQIGVDKNTVGKHRKSLPKIQRPQLLNTDAKETLSELGDGSVDLIVTDPPYGIEFNGQRYDTANQDALEGDENTELIESVAEELYRVLAEDSHCYVFCRWDVLPVVLDAYADPFTVDTTIVWDKDDGGHGMGDLDDWAPRHELIVKCSKGSRPLNGDREPNVIRQQDARFTADEKSHPTQKPRPLIEKLIEKSSDEGEIVFDPFGGVYTTAAASVELDRKCLSAEIDVDHHSTGRDRIEGLIESKKTDRTIVQESEVV